MILEKKDKVKKEFTINSMLKVSLLNTLYSITLCKITLYCITLHYIALHYISLHNIALHSIALHYTVILDMVRKVELLIINGIFRTYYL